MPYRRDSGRTQSPTKIAQYSLTQWGHRDDLPSTAIYAITQTPDGFLWLGTSDGLVRFDGLRFLQVSLLKTDKSDAMAFDARLSSSQRCRAHWPVNILPCKTPLSLFHGVL
jgi:hypothetical protein